MKNLSNTPADGQPPQEPENLPLPHGDDTPIMSLAGLLDLLTVMEPELADLPSPLPLFSRELAAGILERLGVSE